VVKAARVRRYLLPPVLSLGFISASRAFLAFVPPYLRDSGMGEEAIGMLMGVFRLAPILVLIPFGVLGDRLEPRRLITMGLVLFAGPWRWRHRRRSSCLFWSSSCWWG